MDADELEQERLERIAQQDEDRREYRPDWQQSYATNEFSIHEALHLAHVFGDMVDRHLMDHPVVLLHPHLFALASKAGEALADLYQAIGNIVPDDDGAHQR